MSFKNKWTLLECITCCYSVLSDTVFNFLYITLNYFQIGDGLVTWEEYLKALSVQIKKQAYEEQLFTQAFKKFDKDNSGFIDKEELKAVLKRKGAKWTDDDLAYLDDLFLEADEDGNGRVEYKGITTFCVHFIFASKELRSTPVEGSGS